jgi:hypothetical protein
VRLHRGTGKPARFTSQNHITDYSAERCRTPLSHHGAERACVPKDMAAAMPKVIKMNLSLSCNKKKTPRARGGSRWRLAGFGWSPSRRIWARTKVSNESALKALRRAQPRYNSPPERPPWAPPGLALRHAGLAWPLSRASAPGKGSECCKRPLRESQHPPLLPQLRLSTTTPSGVFQNSTEILTHSLKFRR